MNARYTRKQRLQRCCKRKKTRSRENRFVLETKKKKGSRAQKKGQWNADIRKVLFQVGKMGPEDYDL